MVYVWFTFFSCFLLLMRIQVLAVSHSLCCLVFFPRTSLHVAFQVSLRPCHVSSTDSSSEFAEPVSQFKSVDLSLCFVFQAVYVVFVGWLVCSVSVGFQLDHCANPYISGCIVFILLLFVCLFVCLFFFAFNSFLCFALLFIFFFPSMSCSVAQAYCEPKSSSV